MGTVTNLNPTGDIVDFLDFLYGVEEGLVYLPTKDPSSGMWFETWFNWPANREDIVTHVYLQSKTREVYISPVLFSEAKINAAYVKGSSVVWSEFDGAIPSTDEMKEANAPYPTMRVRSSNGGHEHWYWKLDKFSTDLKTLQDINKALSYSLGADPSGWDIEQVLRPVGSINHKRNGKPVLLISNTRKYSTLEDFNKLPPVEQFFVESDFDKQAIPKADIVLLKYAWQSSEIELIRSRAHEGQRSSMLTKLGHICCEKGMDNGEVYAILEYADSRWKKFYNRTNKKQCYIRLIDYVRQKHPYESATTEAETPEAFKYRIRGFMTHFNETENLDWIIPGLLHHSASMFIVGKSGSLKTALATELGINLALGRSILNWENRAGRPLKMMMWSLEMGESEVKERQIVQVKRHTEEELAQLEENFLIYDDPNSVQLFNAFEAEHFKEAVLEYKPDGLIIDSAQMSMSPDMSSEEQVKKSVRVLQELRHRHNFFSIVIHHPRKDVAGAKAQRMTLSDLFGSQVLANSATTVIGMQKRERKDNEPQRIEMIHLKTRFAEVPADYDIELNKEDFTFRRPVITLGGPEPQEMNIIQMASDITSKPKRAKRGDVNGSGLTF